MERILHIGCLLLSETFLRFAVGVFATDRIVVIDGTANEEELTAVECKGLLQIFLRVSNCLSRAELKQELLTEQICVATLHRAQAQNVLLVKVEVARCLVLCGNDADVHGPGVVIASHKFSCGIFLHTSHVEVEAVEGDRDLFALFELVGNAFLGSPSDVIAEHIRKGAAGAGQPLPFLHFRFDCLASFATNFDVCSNAIFVTVRHLDRVIDWEADCFGLGKGEHEGCRAQLLHLLLLTKLL